MTFWRNVLPNILHQGQNAILVVKKWPQNFYQCSANVQVDTMRETFHRIQYDRKYVPNLCYYAANYDLNFGILKQCFGSAISFCECQKILNRTAKHLFDRDACQSGPWQLKEAYKTLKIVGSDWIGWDQMGSDGIRWDLTGLDEIGWD